MKLFGIIFIIIAILIFVNFFRMSKICTEKVAAEITRIETHLTRQRDGRRKSSHDVYVRYYYNGRIYDKMINFYYAGMHEGGTVTLYINPYNPEEYYNKTSQVIGGIVILIFGILFTVLS